MSKSIRIVPSLAAHTEMAKCSVCSLKTLCLPHGLSSTELGQLDKLVVRRRRLERDESLYRMGDPFRNLYAVRFGQLKTYQLDAHGSQQITGFQMTGDLLGLDAIGGGSHHCGALALEDSEVCEISYADLEEMLTQLPRLMQHFHRIMSNEISREQGAMLFLGSAKAEQRFAIFLLGLSARHAARGYSATSFQLRMSREEIGSYLSLTIESVSRLISAFRKSGWIEVDNREVEILDLASLRALSAGMGTAGTFKSAAKVQPRPGKAMGMVQHRIAA
ncbi:fumarate/nitrate reduction transcriptional regulator Fnr [Massilia cavernae]|uniref:Fumarate/nitrate reduction transcriptional regulator Fnr n=1 Tax=Massilia cavernae TaxID=2320864 RepID=A0A418XA55_9BURK|nr:fumarate/nitrate reduction transcriptional regulator Fnr [Massilia cavernae]RJG09382.1 fumarate/nitrate reduction transcriptional regulator Fnr [Massilia cavernae]